jgi:hypothetical protein
MTSTSLLAVAVGCCLLGVPVPDSGTGLSDARIETLIEELASPNEAPTKRSGSGLRLPPGYDRSAQQEVYEARRRLFALGTQAFGVLIKHFDDDRYCSTQDTGYVDENWSVGKTCYLILKCNVQAYGSRPYALKAKGDKREVRKIPFRPEYVDDNGLKNANMAAEWWEARKNNSLAELQIEALEWAIAQESRDPNKYSEAEHSYLAGLLSKLRDSGSPLPPASLPIAK